MSTDVRDDEQVQLYLLKVCGEVKAADIHRAIRLELESHIQELIDCKMDEGKACSQALEEALVELGDPLKIGKGLHQVHKPKMEWGLLAIVLIFLGMALFAIFAVGMSTERRMQIDFSFFEHELLFVAIGLGVMLGLYFVDYRKMERWAWGAMALPFLLVLLAHEAGTRVEGRLALYIGGFVIDIAAVSLCCFVISVAAKSTHKRWRQAPLWLRLALFVAVPSFFFIHIHNPSSMILYVAAYTTIQLAVQTRRRELLSGLLIWLVSGCAYVLREPYNVTRLIGFLHPNEDRQNVNYMVWNSIESICSAGWWGQGFAAVNERLPNIHSEMLFTYLIYSQGWIAGIVIVLSCLLLVSRLVRTGQLIRDTFGRAIVQGFTAVIGVQFGWNFAMSVGWLPIAGFQMPFLSYDGSRLILVCACIGCILSVYRKKDRISIASSSFSRRS